MSEFTEELRPNSCGAILSWKADENRKPIIVLDEVSPGSFDMSLLSPVQVKLLNAVKIFLSRQLGTIPVYYQPADKEESWLLDLSKFDF
jgi:hypothetical protein